MSELDDNLFPEQDIMSGDNFADEEPLRLGGIEGEPDEGEEFEFYEELEDKVEELRGQIENESMYPAAFFAQVNTDGTWQEVIVGGGTNNTLTAAGIRNCTDSTHTSAAITLAANQELLIEVETNDCTRYIRAAKPSTASNATGSFAVWLSQVAGDAGSLTAYPTFTYDVYTDNSYTGAIATGVSVEWNRPFMTAVEDGQHGLAEWKGGTLRLLTTDERPLRNPLAGMFTVASNSTYATDIIHANTATWTDFATTVTLSADQVLAGVTIEVDLFLAVWKDVPEMLLKMSMDGNDIYLSQNLASSSTSFAYRQFVTLFVKSATSSAVTGFGLYADGSGRAVVPVWPTNENTGESGPPYPPASPAPYAFSSATQGPLIKNATIGPGLIKFSMKNATGGGTEGSAELIALRVRTSVPYA